MKNTLSKILAMVIAVLMVVSMFSFAAFAATDDAIGGTVVATADEATADEATTDEATADEATTDEPVVTPDEPVVTPDEPVVTPDEPVVTPDEPVVTPDEPVVTPDEPVVTPDEPVVTPDEPVVTPDEPVVTPDEPVVTPDEPVVTPDEPTVDYIYGDVDLNGKVNVKDATLIQKATADLETLDDIQAILADVNGDGKVNVKDATEIQKWLALLSDNTLIGTAFDATMDEVPEVETPDEPVVETPDEPVVEETKYYLVGYINGADYGIEADWANLGEYVFVNGTVTIELTQDSYVIVKDETNTGYWTDGWKDMNPGTVTLGEFGANNNKMHVAPGTVTFTWDAETLTLTATAA